MVETIPRQKQTLDFPHQPKPHSMKPFWIAVACTITIILLAFLLLTFWPEPEVDMDARANLRPSERPYAMQFSELALCENIQDYTCLNPTTYIQAGEQGFFINKVRLTTTNNSVNLRYYYEILDSQQNQLLASEINNYVSEELPNIVELPISHTIRTEQSDVGNYTIVFHVEDLIRQRQLVKSLRFEIR